MLLYLIVGICGFVVGGFTVGVHIFHKMSKPTLGAINIFYNDFEEDPYIYLEVYPGASSELFNGKKATLDIKTTRYKSNSRK